MGDVTMTATLYGGPADGAVIVLHEPIPTVLRTPLELALVDVARTEARMMQACQLDGVYHLECGDQGLPLRYVRNGRPLVRYLAHVTRKRPADA